MQAKNYPIGTRVKIISKTLITKENYFIVTKSEYTNCVYFDIAPLSEVKKMYKIEPQKYIVEPYTTEEIEHLKHVLGKYFKNSLLPIL